MLLLRFFVGAIGRATVNRRLVVSVRPSVRLTPKVPGATKMRWYHVPRPSSSNLNDVSEKKDFGSLDSDPENHG